ncbi:class I SAM-dependent methyltransferase, partial [Jannaschia sp.]|nr:class I SAM-dependent methyltransferase [Jannaschia sp.]
MRTTIVRQAEPALPSLDTALPMSRREIYWRPKYVAASGFLDHLPVLFWLTADLAPQGIVTLGGADEGSAVAHLALCQAVERLGLDADCTGIDTWPGGDAVPDDTVTEFADSHYDDFSRLISAPDAVAPGLFDKGAVDLLV